MLGVKKDTDLGSNICVLVSESDPELKYVLLDKEPLLLGRTFYTGIGDQRLSKNQSIYNNMIIL